MVERFRSIKLGGATPVELHNDETFVRYSDYAALEAQLAKQFKPENCCVCGRIVDPRETKDGGDVFGCQVEDGKWVCSPDCYDEVTGQAQLAEKREVRVKPLVWENDGREALVAYSVFGEYRAYAKWAYLDGKLIDVPGETTGQAIAQAHHDRRILSALDEPAPKVTEGDLLAELAKHINWEIDWDSPEPDYEGSECQWRVHEVNGGINDREWKLIGFGPTPADAIRAALAAQEPST